MHDAVWAESHGLPGVCVATPVFQPLIEVRRRQLGYPDLPVVYVPHPFINRTAEEVDRIAEESVDAVVRGIVR